MFVFGNPVREAGLGGFEWRDATIMDEIKELSSIRFKGIAKKGLLYALFISPALFLLFHYSILALILTVALGVFVYIAKLHKSTPYSPALIGVGCLLAVAVGTGFHSLGTLAYTLLGIALVTSIIRREVLALGTLLMASTAIVTENWGILIFLAAFLLTLTVSVLQYQHDFGKIMLHNSKRWNATEERPQMPLGYQKIGEQVLKEALKVNSGRISARHRGSMAERRTAIKLLGLPKGSFSYHDLPLPGADAANIDHLLITTKGVFVADTKLFVGEITKNSTGNVIKKSKSGEQSLASVSKQMRWASRALQKYLADVQVKPIVIVQRAEMESAVWDDTEKTKVLYLSHDSVTRFFENLPDILDVNQMNQIKEAYKLLVQERNPVYAKN